MCLASPKAPKLPPPPEPPPAPNTARMMTPDEKAVESAGGTVGTARSRLRIDPSNGMAGNSGLSIPT